MKIQLRTADVTFTDNGITDSLEIDLDGAHQVTTSYPSEDGLSLIVVVTIDGLILKDSYNPTPLVALTELNDSEVCVSLVAVFTTSLDKKVVTDHESVQLLVCKLSLTALRSFVPHRFVSSDVYSATYNTMAEKLSRCAVRLDAVIVLNLDEWYTT